MTESRAALTCDEVSELTGLYVLDALEADERAVVADHLATCTSSAHGEFAELGAVVPALASAAPPAGAPAALKRRVLESYRSEMATTATATEASLDRNVEPTPPKAKARDSRWPTPTSWLPAIATLLLLVVVGVWGFGQALEASQARDRAAALSRAIAAMSAPGSEIAVLQGSGSATGASGFAAFPADGGAHVVLVGLPQAPTGQAYQAWYIADGTPTSAGLMSVSPDGYVIMSDPEPLPGAEVFAVTLEPAGGSAQPTTQPIVVGDLTAPG